MENIWVLISPSWHSSHLQTQKKKGMLNITAKQNQGIIGKISIKDIDILKFYNHFKLYFRTHHARKKSDP
jgi:hypothetical protein